MEETLKVIVIGGPLVYIALAWGATLWAFCTGEWDAAWDMLIGALVATSLVLLIACPVFFFFLMLALLALGILINIVRAFAWAVVQLNKLIVGD